jgi:hypothetical protein
MKSAAAVFAITFSMINPLLAQVHIRESAIIAPAQVKRTMETGGNVNNHSIRFELYFSDADTGYLAVVGGYYTNLFYPCAYDTVVYSASSPLVFELDSPVAQAYEFEPAVLIEGNVYCPVGYKIYQDNVLAASWSGLIQEAGYMKGLFILEWIAGVDDGLPLLLPTYSSYFGLSFGGPLYYQATQQIDPTYGFDCSASSWSPSTDTMSLTILSGSQYASFYKLGGDTAGYVKVGSLVHTVGMDLFGGVVVLEADGIQPDSLGDYVVVKAESNGFTKVDSVQVLRSPIVVTFDPPEVAPGDTTNIILGYRNPDGTINDIPGYQQFEVGIWSPGNCGTILSGSDTAQYFTYRSEPFEFIASDMVTADSIAVRVGLVSAPVSSTAPMGKGNLGKQNVKAQPALINTNKIGSGSRVLSVKSGANVAGHKSVLNANDFSSNTFGIGYVKIEHTILLGQTKYYYATQDPNNSNNLIIQETTTEPPALGAGGIASARFDDPVAADGSEKNPVYWEKKWPEYNGTQFQQMDKLPDGMIRLVGRYWEQGKTFKTTLTAHTSDGKSGSIVIEVKKPSRLGGQYAKAKDVFDSELSIDSVCIRYAGLYGIPPQLIKGQMEEEAATYNFGGDIGIGFAPSYRYEPYTEQFDPRIRERKTNPFFVILTDVNDPPIPNHQYVQVIPYIYPNRYVWDVIYDHSQLVNDIPDASHRAYGIRTYENTMNFGPYTTIQTKYDNYLKDYEKFLPLQQAAPLANARMVTFLRDEWDGGVPNGPKGLKNIVAQTRIASSYGLLQMLYRTALGIRYREDISHLPENLNVTETMMSLSIPYQKSLLIDGIGASIESVGNWPDGFEKSLYDFVYANWNKRSTYNDEVFQKSRNYLPQP